MTTMRTSPLVLQAQGAVAFSDEPRLLGYGGVTVEAVNRNSIGAIFGVQFAPSDSRFRLSGGATAIFAPYSLYGATASGGMCQRWTRSMKLCGDAVLTTYFAGTDLVPHQTENQIQLVIGIQFDGPS